MVSAPDDTKRPVLPEGIKKMDADLTAASNGTPIKLQVGSSVFETTKEELCGRDGNSYFHAQFSERWKQAGDDGSSTTTYTIQDRSGRLFQFVLFYLQFGDIPRLGPSGLSALDDQSLCLLKTEADFYGLVGLVALCDNSGPKHLLLQGLSNTSYEAKVSFFVPQKFATVVLDKLKASQTDSGENCPPLFEWQIVDTAAAALANVVPEGLDLENIPADATEEDILEFLKTGEVPTEDFKKKYLLVSQRSHKRLYEGSTTCVVVLSKPEHLALYERLVEFLDMPMDGYFVDGREIHDPRLLTRAVFLSEGGWTKYDGCEDPESVDQIVSRFHVMTEKYFVDDPPEVDPEDHHDLAFECF